MGPGTVAIECCATLPTPCLCSCAGRRAPATVPIQSWAPSPMTILALAKALESFPSPTTLPGPLSQYLPTFGSLLILYCGLPEKKCPCVGASPTLKSALKALSVYPQLHSFRPFSCRCCLHLFLVPEPHQDMPGPQWARSPPALSISGQVLCARR